MTIKSIKERARDMQRAEFAKGGDLVPEGLEDLTIGVYDQIDNLDAEKRSLLIRDLLGKLGGLARDLDDITERAVFTATLGIANYTNEVGREAGSMTSTGDRAVDSILEDISSMLAAQFKALLGGAAPLVEAAADRVKARVEAGEDFEVVAAEEEAAMRKAIAESRGDEVPETVNASARPDDGLYL
jgi:hypothetical protein